MRIVKSLTNTVVILWLKQIIEELFKTNFWKIWWTWATTLTIFTEERTRRDFSKTAWLCLQTAPTLKQYWPITWETPNNNWAYRVVAHPHADYNRGLKPMRKLRETETSLLPNRGIHWYQWTLMMEIKMIDMQSMTPCFSNSLIKWAKVLISSHWTSQICTVEAAIQLIGWLILQVRFQAEFHQMA